MVVSLSAICSLYAIAVRTHCIIIANLGTGHDSMWRCLRNRKSYDNCRKRPFRDVLFSYGHEKYYDKNVWATPRDAQSRQVKYMCSWLFSIWTPSTGGDLGRIAPLMLRGLSFMHACMHARTHTHTCALFHSYGTANLSPLFDRFKDRT